LNSEAVGALLLTMAVLCRAQVAPSGPPKKPILKRLIGTEALAATVPGAIMRQVRDWPEEWGRKPAGFEKRLGSLYGQFVAGVLIESGVKAIHREDTRYRRLGQGNFFRRAGHAIVDTATARKSDGSRTVALSMPAVAYGSWAIATLWSPREFRNAGSILRWGTAGMGSAAGANMAKEFWPDLKGVFHKRK
jgi:hypothetical protein